MSTVKAVILSVVVSVLGIGGAASFIIATTPEASSAPYVFEADIQAALDEYHEGQNR